MDKLLDIIAYIVLLVFLILVAVVFVTLIYRVGWTTVPFLSVPLVFWAVHRIDQ